MSTFYTIVLARSHIHSLSVATVSKMDTSALLVKDSCVDELLASVSGKELSPDIEFKTSNCIDHPVDFIAMDYSCVIGKSCLGFVFVWIIPSLIVCKDIA